MASLAVPGHCRQAGPTIAAKRGLEPRQLSAAMCGELDWVVMKALDKDRSRRYETANAFALDLRCYLAERKGAARIPNPSGRLGRFAVRTSYSVWTVPSERTPWPLLND